MKQDWKTGPISDVYLERYVLGELPEAQLRALETRLAADPLLRDKLQSIKDHESVFEASFPVEKMVTEIKAAAVKPQRHSPRSISQVVPTLAERFLDLFTVGKSLQWAGAFALLVLTVLPMIMVKNALEPEVVRIKGKQAELRLYRNTSTGPVRITNGDSAAPGDIIQVGFHPGNFAYGAIFSVDGNGSVTLHWPASPDASTAWSTTSEHRLSEAFQLDQAPYFERFHLLLSNHPIDLEKGTAQVAASAAHDEKWLADQLQKSVTVITFVLKKAARP